MFTLPSLGKIAAVKKVSSGSSNTNSMISLEAALSGLTKGVLIKNVVVIYSTTLKPKISGILLQFSVTLVLY